MKRIRGGSDFLSIPWKKRGSKAPLPWPHPVDQVPTQWTRQPPSGPAKRVLRVGWSVRAVDVFECQKALSFCSWTLWTTTLILRIRLRPSGSAPI